MFHGCEKYWWASVLFIGNLVPWVVDITQGCWIHSWFVACYFQIFCLIPFLVILYMKSKSSVACMGWCIGCVCGMNIFK